MRSLFDLPTSLVSSLLSEWTQAGNLASLDTACCNAAARGAYLEAMRFSTTDFPGSRRRLDSKGVSIEFITGSSRRCYTGFMRWAVKRCVGVRQFHLFESSNAGYPYSHTNVHVLQAETKALFDAVGERLERLYTGNDPEWLGALELASRKCTSLKVLSVQNYSREMWGMAYVNALLDGCAQTLERVKIQNAEAEMELGAFTLPKLRCLHLESAPVQEEALSESLRHCPLLESFICTNLEQQDDCFDALAQHCPLLKVLGFGNVGDETYGLVRMLKACVNIEVVDLALSNCCNNHSLSDAHIEAIAQYGANIRALRVSGVATVTGLLTSASLIFLLQMRNLSRLVIDSMEAPSAALVEVLMACEHLGPNLQELEMTVMWTESSATGLGTVLCAMPRLQKVTFAECDFVCGAFMRELSASSTVEVLRVASSRLQEDSVAALVTGFPALREMHVTRHMRDFCSPVAQELWRLLRPQLQFTVHHDYSDKGFPGCWGT